MTRIPALLVLPLALSALGCANSEADLGTGSGSGGGTYVDLCNKDGTFACDGNTAVLCSNKEVRLDCSALGKSCEAGIGCAVCSPGAGTCENGNATVCRGDGSGWVTYECDPMQGMTCGANGCTGACSWSNLGQSYVGCDYSPTVTLNNGLWNGFHFAVALSNLGTVPANVVVTRGIETVESVTVEPGALEVIELPWVKELKGPEPNFMGQPQPVGPSAVVKDGAYRVRSDQPLAAYQFNPLEYQLDPAPAECPSPAEGKVGCFSYSNDASLLLPAHVLREKYTTMAWPDLGCKAGFFAVTAIFDDTEIKMKPLGQISAGGGFDSSGQGFAVLSAGSVLQIHGLETGGPFCFNSPGSDLSGTLIEASRPVQVIAGHSCANIPAPETQACDHVEESMFPLETLGNDYVVAVPAPPSGVITPAVSHTIRISALEPDTELTFDPPIEEPVVLQPNDPPLELRYVRDNVHVHATGRIAVAQFMHGTDANGDEGESGDPDESMSIPSGQYRSEYTFLAPDNYITNYVDVIAPLDGSVAIDDVPVPYLEPVGESKWGVAHVKLEPGSVHRATGTQPFGINVYGYGDWTSYLYPGGLNLGSLDVTVR
jgi:hypothetical protein